MYVSLAAAPSANTAPPRRPPRNCETCTRTYDCARLNECFPQLPQNCPDYQPTQEAVLRTYPRLAAHLICHSAGYLTPRAAANLILAYKHGREFWCEWIAHLYSCGVQQPTRHVLEMAVKLRKTHSGYMADYGLARAIIARSLAGNDPIFASWF